VYPLHERPASHAQLSLVIVSYLLIYGHPAIPNWDKMG
jgi:hypothetical protein